MSVCMSECSCLTNPFQCHFFTSGGAAVLFSSGWMDWFTCGYWCCRSRWRGCVMTLDYEVALFSKTMFVANICINSIDTGMQWGWPTYGQGTVAKQKLVLDLGNNQAISIDPFLFCLTNSLSSNHGPIVMYNDKLCCCFFFTIFQHHWERERLVNYWRDWGGATVELDIGRSHSLCLANSDHIFRNISYPRLPKYHSQHYLFLISVFFFNNMHRRFCGWKYHIPLCILFIWICSLCLDLSWKLHWSHL